MKENKRMDSVSKYTPVICFSKSVQHSCRFLNISSVARRLVNSLLLSPPFNYIEDLLITTKFHMNLKLKIKNRYKVNILFNEIFAQVAHWYSQQVKWNFTVAWNVRLVGCLFIRPVHECKIGATMKHVEVHWCIVFQNFPQTSFIVCKKSRDM